MPKFLQTLVFGFGSVAMAFGEAPDRNWWSLRPLKHTEIPSSGDSVARNPIDAYVRKRRLEVGLKTGTPTAARHHLIRRLSFDLCGLPPDPDDVEHFTCDDRPEATARLVDRLLASPRYGERWARHWLDVVHYGDTHGYDKDKPRPNAWPYRDYVIRSLNTGKPYDRFVKEQLAGDVLFPNNPDGIVALGFIAAGPWDFIGHAEVPEEKIDGKVARHLDRDDMVANTLNTFCSFTVQCAQCHDHKRDPVTMTDYYRLQAVFAAVDRADRSYDRDPAVTRKRNFLTNRRKALEERLQNLEKQIEAKMPPELMVRRKSLDKSWKAIRTTAVAEGKSSRPTAYGYHSQVAKNPDAEKWVQLDLGNPAPIDSVALFPADEYGWDDFGFPHRFKIEVADGADFKTTRVLADHTEFDFPRPGAGPVIIDGLNVKGRFVRVTATKLWNRRLHRAPKTGDWIFALGEMVILSGDTKVSPKSVQALDSIESLPRWGKQDLVDGVFGKLRAPEWLASVEKHTSRFSTLAKALEKTRALGESELDEKEKSFARDFARVVGVDLVKRRDKWRSEITSFASTLSKLPRPSTVYCATVHSGSGAFKGRGHLDGKPREIRVLNRGDVTSPDERVGPGAVEGIVPGYQSTFDLPEDHDEGERRAALAEWITDKDNPLTWRSVVNRVWHYHFGRGIVSTPNDFGRLGALPTHPELLDWLALEFRDGGGSIKNLHRLICNSATYAQASHNNDPKAMELDATNRFLWRMPRRRLEAETFRDAVLAHSGLLDLRMGGPGYRDFVIEKPQHSPHYRYDRHDPLTPDTMRRSVYRFIVRSQPEPFMTTLDCADPSQQVARRGETLTALQALAQMNHSLMTAASEHFAERLESETISTGERIEFAWRLCFHRRPTDREHGKMTRYAQTHGLSAACRVIFNLNEYTFLD